MSYADKNTGMATATQEQKKMSYMPTRILQKLAWLVNFKDIIFPNQATLGISAAEFTEIEDAINAATAAAAAAEDARLAAIAANATKTEAIALAVATASPFALEIKNNPSVSVALKALLGLTTSITPSGPVAVPTFLEAFGQSNGFVELRWKRNGNVSRTTFIIQAKPVSGGVWTQVGVSSSAKWISDEFVPGDPVQFRVLAFRGGETSQPSGTVSLWNNEESVVNLQAA